MPYVVSISTPDSDERRDAQLQQLTRTSSSSSSSRRKFRLLTSLPRAFFSFDRHSLTKRRRSSVDTATTTTVAAAAAVGTGSDDDDDENVDATMSH